MRLVRYQRLRSLLLFMLSWEIPQIFPQRNPPKVPIWGMLAQTIIVVPNVETLVSTREILRTVWGQNFRRTLEFSVNLWAHRINLLGLGG